MPKSKASGYETVAGHWYVEPVWAIEMLAERVRFYGHIHDPCCGEGRIPSTFQRYGYEVSGSDIVDRGYMMRTGGKLDFLASSAADPYFDGVVYENIVMNPPYGGREGIAEQFVRRALQQSTKKVGIIVRLDFLASEKRYDLFTGSSRPALVLICSNRPSMPPGGGEVAARGGQHDYCWTIWDHNYDGPTEIDWLWMPASKRGKG